MKLTLYSIVGLSLITILAVGCGGGSTKSTSLEFSSSASKNVQEGNIDVLTVQTMAKDNVVYSIVGGSDANKFQIDPESGNLEFKTPPDFENPIDADENNQYVVTVKAVNIDGLSNTMTVTVIVTNNTADDGPAFTSANETSLKENKQLDFKVVADGAIAFTLSGEDQKRFSIDENTHKLQFINFLPDFERPSDANHDNKYKIDIISMDDQNHSSLQAFTAEITNDPTDDVAEKSWEHIYKTGANDGIISNDPFGDDRSFTAQNVTDNRVVHVGKRIWQDSLDNKIANYSFNEAENYCNNLDYAGHSDWRVPNRHELYEIVNYGNSHSSNPTIDEIFQNRAKGNYWTQEEVIGHAGNVLTNEAFAVNFTDGASYTIDRGTASSVRCVRGDKLIYKDYIDKDDDDIYRDSKTGFMWAKPAGPESMPQAKARCESLVFGGYNDWRLPNISELHTIMPSVLNQDPGHPYGAEPLLRDGAHQLWSATKINATDALYLDNYWNNNWGGSPGVAADANHPLGRDRMNDAVLPADDEGSVFSICIRGGHL